MADFEINGINYKSSKMAAMTQLFVLKRLAPATVALQSLIGKTEFTNAEMIAPMGEALHILPDEDLQYIIDCCMKLCQRENGHGGWAKIWNTAAMQPMFDDIGLGEMLQVVTNVLKDSLQNFSLGLR